MPTTAATLLDQFISLIADQISSRIGASRLRPATASGTAMKRADRGRSRSASAKKAAKRVFTCPVEGCKNPSRGPRFSFFCAEHFGKMSTAERTAASAAAKERRRAA